MMKLSILLLLLISYTMGSPAAPRYLIMPIELERMESGGGDNTLPSYSSHHLHSGKSLTTVNNPGTRDTLNSFASGTTRTFRPHTKTNSQTASIFSREKNSADEVPSCTQKEKWSKTTLVKDHSAQTSINTTVQENTSGFRWENAADLGWWIITFAFFSLLAILYRVSS